MRNNYSKPTHITGYVKFILRRIGFDRPGERDTFHRALESQVSQQWARQAGSKQEDNRAI